MFALCWLEEYRNTPCDFQATQLWLSIFPFVLKAFVVVVETEGFHLTRRRRREVSKYTLKAGGKKLAGFVMT